MTNKKTLAITPQSVTVAIHEPDHSVLMILDVSHPELGLAPGLSLALNWTPEESRMIGQSLIRKADEAEAGLPRA